MAKSKAVTGARNIVSKKDIIKTVEQRYEKVKAEKARRIKEYKESLTELTNDASNQKKKYIEKIGELYDEIDNGKNVKDNQKKIAELTSKIKILDERKYTILYQLIPMPLPLD